MVPLVLRYHTLYFNFIADPVRKLSVSGLRGSDTVVGDSPVMPAASRDPDLTPR